jgi:hypothetical protein
MVKICCRQFDQRILLLVKICIINLLIKKIYVGSSLGNIIAGKNLHNKIIDKNLHGQLFIKMSISTFVYRQHILEGKTWGILYLFFYIN